jgi:hypothetical protein
MQPRCVRRHLPSPLSAQDGRSQRVRPPASPMMNCQTRSFERVQVILKIDMCPLRDHARIVNVVAHRFPVSGLDGALMPHGRLIYPIVVTRRIGFGLLSTD